MQNIIEDRERRDQRSADLPSGAEPPSRQDAMLVEPTTEEDSAARQVVNAAFAVHTTLGPGLLESVYQECMELELRRGGVPFARQVALPLEYRGIRMNSGFRIDLIVDTRVVVEIKAVDPLSAIHEAQLLTYLKLSGLRLGLLINFNVARIKYGIRRIVRSR